MGKEKEKNEVLENDNKQLKALLIATYKGGLSHKPACEEHLDELELLAETYGIKTIKKISCPIRKIDASIYISSGKLEEFVQLAKDLEVDSVIFDEEMTPAQQRNLEQAFGIRVMDRTEIILGVFAQRAQTKEARLQIELAQVKYQAPRLKNMWTHLERQAGTGGGGGYLKGMGEKQIEVDRRLLKNRIEKLQSEIKEVKLNRETQRVARTRSDIPIFAIIGYTNAGKSTLLNALTNANVFVEDKLFATLDTTTRKFMLGNNQQVLLIDTVGFIRKLPHLLVAAFKSTLEEAMHADILLHLVDASHPMAEEQAETSYQVLKQLNSEEKPIITVLNKIDKCSDPSTLTRLRIKYPKTVQISALEKRGFEELQEAMVHELNAQRRPVRMRIPQSDYAVVSEVMRLGHILRKEYDENDVLLQVTLPIVVVDRFKSYVLPEKKEKS